MRFRSGISAGGGAELVSNYSFTMFGVDGRLGLQINDLIAVYAQPHLSFGTGSIGSVSGTTGTFAITFLGEGTFFGRLFGAIGGGYGILNNPSGAVLHVRAGGYPLMKVADDGVRRKGLMVSLDSRTFFASGFTVEHILVSIGYEKY